MTEERLPPQNLEVERAVLGAMMMDSEALYRALELLSVEDFYHDGHARIFGAMKKLAENDRAVDYVSLADILDKEGHLEKVGGRSYLVSLLSSIVTPGNLDYHAEIIQEKAVLRSLIRAGGDIVTRAYSGTQDVDDLLNGVEQMIWAIGEKRIRGEFAPLSSIIPETFEKLDEIHHSKRAVTGLATGYTDLDEITTGLHPADYVIIAARPSVGKTALALGIALNVALKEEKGVAIFSLEMASEQLVTRLMATKFRVDSQRLRSGKLDNESFKKISKDLDSLSRAQIFIDDSAEQTVLNMRAKLRRLKRRQKIDLVIIDYLQLLTSGQRRVENRQQEITTISRQIKALGRELDIPVIALSQLSRQSELRDDKIPRLSDLRESGAIEQDADTVMFIYRPEVHKQKKIKVELDGKSFWKDATGIAEIIIAKQRNGPVGQIYLKFHKKYVSFENVSMRKVPDYVAKKIEEEEEFNPNNHGGT